MTSLRPAAVGQIGDRTRGLPEHIDYRVQPEPGQSSGFAGGPEADADRPRTDGYGNMEWACGNLLFFRFFGAVWQILSEIASVLRVSLLAT